MKFATLPVLCLIGSSFAAPTRLVQRDLAVIQYNVKRVDSALVLLDQSLSRRPGANQQQVEEYFRAALQLGQQVGQELRTSAIEIRRGPSVNDLEALQLAGSVNPMQSTLSRVVNGFIAVKRQAVAVGAQNAILDMLIQAEVDSGAFMDAIISKLGFLSQSFGTSLKTQTNTVIAKAVAEYRRR